MPERSLAAWLELLYARHADEIKPGIDRIMAVATHAGLLSFPASVIIHIAGTNGKGSTVAALNAIYTAAGLRVGVYTSPHLQYFNERIVIANHCITDAELCRIFSMVEVARMAVNVELSFFEMATLAALQFFHEQQPDVILLECGMGGRWDATNILASDCAVITTIDYDHQEYLGATLAEIATEKAGILRAGSYTVLADSQDCPVIYQEAARLGVTLYQGGRDFDYPSEKAGLLHPLARAAAQKVVEILHDKIPVPAEIISRALQTARIAARHEIIKRKYILDVAHNNQSVRELKRFLESLQISGKVHAIFAAMGDKNVPAMIQQLDEMVDYWYPVQLQGKRAVKLADLQQILHDVTACWYEGYAMPQQALQKAETQAQQDDILVIFGSFVLVGALMEQVYEMGN